jgi:hypothetical protein
MLWRFYDDHYPRRMVGKDAPDAHEHRELTRYAAFLDTDLEYEWPKANFIRIGGLGILPVLTLGLLWPLDWWIKRQNRRFEEGLRRSGDLEVWPFIKRADFADGARGD